MRNVITPKLIPHGGDLVHIAELIKRVIDQQTSNDHWRLLSDDDAKTAPERCRPKPPKMVEDGAGLINTVRVRLTGFDIGSILTPLSRMTVRALTPGNNGQDTRPLSSVVFLRLPKSNAGLIRLLFVMVECIEQPLKRLAGSVTSSEKLDTFRHPTFSLVAGGYSYLTESPA